MNNENKLTHKRETKGIKAHAKKKSEEVYKRVDGALREMALNKEPINFNTVMKKANVSKGFVYQNQEIRERIEKLRDSQKGIKPKQVKDKMTDNSKDILLAAKTKKIKELEDENKNLKKELEVLRGKLYDTL
ncbi:DUF6262 family protein [Aliarcobacter butzleri]|uniref:DUF6262 family protein n=1 Tax=Aliarcobacter butzleri TaxID=28197 RepID=UPI0021B62E74|nr:DUF6262 family protein [Aliarcobacter butzleri]MCT7566418.1 DUF6262 family protein [Aliarcobacter butzleri]